MCDSASSPAMLPIITAEKFLIASSGYFAFANDVALPGAGDSFDGCAGAAAALCFAWPFSGAACSLAAGSFGACASSSAPKHPSKQINVVHRTISQTSLDPCVSHDTQERPHRKGVAFQKMTSRFYLAFFRPLCVSAAW